jgi:hypothetical protein
MYSLSFKILGKINLKESISVLNGLINLKESISVLNGHIGTSLLLSKEMLSEFFLSLYQIPSQNKRLSRHTHRVSLQVAFMWRLACSGSLW